MQLHLKSHGFLQYPNFSELLIPEDGVSISGSSVTEKTRVSGHSERHFSGFLEKDSVPACSLWLSAFCGMLKTNISRKCFLNKKHFFKDRGVTGEHSHRILDSEHWKRT